MIVCCSCFKDTRILISEHKYSLNLILNAVQWQLKYNTILLNRFIRKECLTNQNNALNISQRTFSLTVTVSVLIKSHHGTVNLTFYRQGTDCFVYSRSHVTYPRPVTSQGQGHSQMMVIDET